MQNVKDPFAKLKFTKIFITKYVEFLGAIRYPRNS